MSDIDFTAALVAERSHNKAAAQARRTEARRACEPRVDVVEAMQRSWEGPSNSGNTVIDPNTVTHVPTTGERMISAVERAFSKHKDESRDKEPFGPAKLKELASDLRYQADQLERGF